MRLFLAVNISNRNIKLINNKVDLIKSKIKQNLKWVSKDNWHITLKFLGEVNKSKIDELKKAIDKAVNIEKFYFQLDHIGAFPHMDHAKVIYLGINRGENELINLYNNLEKELYKLNFDRDERKYTPHLTIARTKNDTDYSQLSANIKTFIEDRDFINIYSQVKKISLMKSELYPEGPKYEEIFTKKLK